MPMHVTYMGRHRHKTGIIPRNIECHPSEHSVGIKLIKSLRSGTLSFREERLGLSHKEIVIHSLRSGFSMELSMAWIYLETIMIFGRWSRNEFLRYLRIQVSDLNKGTGDLIVTTQAFYTIPEPETIYYTLGKPCIKYQRLSTQREITNDTNSSLSLLW